LTVIQLVKKFLVVLNQRVVKYYQGKLKTGLYPDYSISSQPQNLPSQDPF